MKGVLTMTSREIAELTGKRHDHVLRDIKRMLEDIGEDGDDAPRIGAAAVKTTYRDEKNEERPEYRLPKDLSICLVAGYDAKLRLAIIRRWDELETTMRNAEELARFAIPAPSPLPDFGPILAAIKALGEHLDARLSALETRAATPALTAPEPELMTAP